MTTDESLVLRVAGRPVGRYLTRPELPERHSPAPICIPSPPCPVRRSPN